MGCRCPSSLEVAEPRCEIYKSRPPSARGSASCPSVICLSTSLGRLLRLPESEMRACRSTGSLKWLTTRRGDLEDGFLTTRGTPPESLLLFLDWGMLGAVDLRVSGWLWRDVAGPGLENVDPRLLCARAGIGSWNQRLPRVSSAASSVMGWAPDIAQGSSLTRLSSSSS